MNVLALDPSINHLGWVIMTTGKVLLSGTINAPPLKTACLVARLDWMIVALDDLMLEKVHALRAMGEVPADVIAIECPEPWGAYKSMASSRSGSLQMLTLLTGVLTCWAINTVGVDYVHLIKVSQHKGQLPKRVTQERMEEKYHCIFRTDHAADACSLGDYILTTKGVQSGT